MKAEDLRTIEEAYNKGLLSDSAAKKYEAYKSRKAKESAPRYGTTRNVYQGITNFFGLGDEIKAGLGAGMVGVSDALGITDTGRSMGENYQAGLDIQRSNQERFREERPLLAYGSEITGDLATGGALLKAGKVALSSSPKAATALRASGVPKMTTKVMDSTRTGGALRRAAIGGGIGMTAAAGTGFAEGEGGLDERLQSALYAAPYGAVVGGVMGATAPAIGRGLSSLVGRKGGDTPPPSSAPPPSGRASGKLSDYLPTGMRTGDVPTMRAEEAARQGLLGRDYEVAMQKVDDEFLRQAEGQVRKIAGDVDAASDEVFMSGVGKLRARYDAQKAAESKIMKERNAALASTTTSKGYVQDSLINKIKDLAKDDDFVVSLPKESMRPIREDLTALDKIVEGGVDEPLRFSMLQAWRSGLNNYPKGTQESVLAGKIAKGYDEWLGGITEDAITGGDKDIVKRVLEANKSYAEFKGKFGTDKFLGQSSAVEDVLRKTDLSEDQIIGVLFGVNVKGKQNTQQVIRRTLEAMPEGAKRDALRKDFKAGYILRAIESAIPQGSDRVRAGTLATKLGDLLKNKAFTRQLATKQDVDNIKSVAEALRNYSGNSSRRDVYSPSGGMVLRALDKVFTGAGFATSGLGGNMLTEASRNLVKEASKSKDRALVDKAIQSYAKDIKNALENRYGYGKAASTGSISGKNGTNTP